MSSKVKQKSSFVDTLKSLGTGSVLVAALSIIGQFFFPFWIAAVAAFVVGIFVHESSGKSYLYGFAAMFLVWSVYAGFLSNINGGTITSAVSDMLGGKVSGTQLIYVTGFIGGLVGGMAAMTGTLFRHLFSSRS